MQYVHRHTIDKDNKNIIIIIIITISYYTTAGKKPFTVLRLSLSNDTVLHSALANALISSLIWFSDCTNLQFLGCHSAILIVLLYGSETWTMTNDQFKEVSQCFWY